MRDPIRSYRLAARANDFQPDIKTSLPDAQDVRIPIWIEVR